VIAGELVERVVPAERHRAAAFHAGMDVLGHQGAGSGPDAITGQVYFSQSMAAPGRL